MADSFPGEGREPSAPDVGTARRRSPAAVNWMAGPPELLVRRRATRPHGHPHLRPRAGDHRRTAVRHRAGARRRWPGALGYTSRPTRGSPSTASPSSATAMRLGAVHLRRPFLQRWTSTNYVGDRATAPASEVGSRRPCRRRASCARGFTSGAPAVMEVASPDGRWLLTEKDDDLWIARLLRRPRAAGRSRTERKTTRWSVRRRDRGRRTGPAPRSMKVDTPPRWPGSRSFTGSNRPKRSEYAPFSKAGNPLPRQEIHIVDVARAEIRHRLTSVTKTSC